MTKPICVAHLWYTFFVKWDALGKTTGNQITRIQTHTHTILKQSLTWNDDSGRLYLVSDQGLIAEIKEIIGNDTTYTTIQYESDEMIWRQEHNPRQHLTNKCQPVE